MLCRSILLLCALLAFDGAAGFGFSSCWLQNLEDAPTLPSLIGAKLEREASHNASSDEGPGGAALATTRSFGPCSRRRFQKAAHARTEADTSHPAIVAEQHPAFAPAAAEPSARTTSPLAWPNKEHA
jgi:hypothetical protein